MGREILFRGFCPSKNGKQIITLDSGDIKGDWVYGYVYKDALIGCNIFQTKPCLAAIMVDPSTVGQYTGLKDKNGREIFEGDIIKAKTFNYPLCIEWDRGECAFVMRSTHSGATCGFMWEIEIIGNIYDNPELLKEESV